ncbi:MAG TPA: SDR family oxidoreductase [Polyangiales bacterium]|nr:SDR family oxidoreductase [Polyangiales bacterium]
MQLRDKTALVTGASRGLGRALAEQLAAGGCKVVLVARGEAELDAALAGIRARGGQAYAIAADVADKTAVYRIVGQANALAGPIDVLINNASTLGHTPLGLLIDSECEDLERVLAVNVVAPFRLTKAVLGSMLLRGSGTIVNISSDAAVEAYPTWGAYGASKAALDQLTRIWAAEHGSSGVRMFSVDPGEMDTELHALAMPNEDRSALAQPASVAARILAMLEEEPRAPHGARVLATGRELAP